MTQQRRYTSERSMREGSESDWRATVTDYALAHGWVYVYFPDSRWVQGWRGWPDLALVRDGRLILAELKTARGRLSPDQVLMGEQLARVEGIDYVVWRPADWPAVERVLRAHARSVPEGSE